MDVLEKYYGRKTFTLYALLLAVPGSAGWRRKLFLPFSILLLSFATFCQLLRFVTEGLKLSLIIELLPTIAATFTTLLYLLYVISAAQKDYDRILSIMLEDLKYERTAGENAIKQEYARNANKFTNIATIVFVVIMCGISLSGFIPYFLDLIIPLNETRELELLAYGEMFIDQKRYFSEIYFFECCNVLVLGLIVGISENMCVIIAQHVCGMFAEIGYQLENINKIGEDTLAVPVEQACLIERRLRLCIERHQKPLQFVLLMNNYFDVPVTLILTTTFSALSVSLVQSTDPELTNVKIILLTIAEIFQFLLVSIMGQKVTEASERVSANAYNAGWHNCSPTVRKLLQMVILRSSKSCKVVARSMYVLSVENFMSVMQTITSFYMVIRQSQ